MIQKILFCVSLGGLLLVSTPAIARTRAVGNQSGKQSQQATKSVSGKITSIGDEGASFVVEVANGGTKQSLQFVLDKNTQVEGHVKTGSMVLVEYQPVEGGTNLCIKVSAQEG